MLIYSSKKLSYSIIFFLNFLTGIEYAVILPTALQYLKKFNGDQFELGLCLSAYSFSSLFSSPLMGKWSDVSKNTKRIILFSNLWQMAGSFMYFVGLSSNFIIISRLVAGVGMGVIGCTFSDIVKTTNLEERSGILSRIMVGRQIGMVIGPAFNFILLNLDFDIGPFHLDKLSAPGLLMFSAWLLLQIIILFFYKNLTDFTQSPAQSSKVLTINEDLDENTPITTSHSSVNSKKNYNSIQQTSNHQNENETNQDLNEIRNEEGEDIAESEHEHLITSQSAPKTHEQNRVKLKVKDNAEAGPLIVRLYNEYIKEEVVCVLVCSFSVFFMQTALETLLTPFTKDYFGWGDIQNSILYAVAGLEIMIVFLLLSFISKKINDRTMLLVGLIGNLSTLIFLIVYLPKAVPNNGQIKDVVLFMAPVFANVFSLPLIVLSSISLLSKLTSQANQGLTQGLRRTMVGIACILGPNWAGIFYKQWYILVGSLIAVLTMALLMTILSFKYLYIKQNNEIKSVKPISKSSNTNNNV